MLTRILPLAFLFLASAAWADVPQITNYLGTMNGDLPIALALNVSPSSDNVAGTYVYSKFGKDIGLTGTSSYAATNQRKFALTESTGKFELVANPKGALAGTWTSADGKKTLPVALAPAAKTVTMVSARSDRYEVRTGYLQLLAQTPFATALNAHLQDAAFKAHNAELKELATDTEQAREFGDTLPWTSESTAFLLYATDGLVSIRTWGYSYTGGAHGNGGYGAENYAWQKGKLVALDAAALIPVADWPKLRTLCITELKAMGAAWPDEIRMDKDNPPTIAFTSKGVLVLFGDYEAGPHSEGPHIVAFTYAAVQSLIPATSPLFSLLAK